MVTLSLVWTGPPVGDTFHELRAATVAGRAVVPISVDGIQRLQVGCGRAATPGTAWSCSATRAVQARTTRSASNVERPEDRGCGDG
jgi:hypothetical protein